MVVPHIWQFTGRFRTVAIVDSAGTRLPENDTQRLYGGLPLRGR